MNSGYGTSRQRYALAVEATPPPRAALLPHIWLSDEEIRQGQRLLEQLPDKAGTPPIALHPVCHAP